MNETTPPKPRNSTAESDSRLAFIYQEALRGLVQQQTAVESLRNRTATLIFAVSFVSSLLGGYALQHGVGLWDWVAIGFLIAVCVLSVILLWPYYNLSFRFDAQDLLDRYIDTDTPATLPDMHRDLALRIKQDWIHNGKTVRKMRFAFQFALIFLVFEIISWMLAVATG